MINKFIVFLLLFIAAGCSITRQIEYKDVQKREYSRLNYLTSQNSSTIYFLNKCEVDCSFLEVKNDSIYFNQDESSEVQIYHLDEIRSIKLDDYKASIGCCLWGGLGALFIGAAFAEMSGAYKKGHPHLGPLIVGIAVSPLGIIPAYIFGGKYEFVFNKVEIEK